MYSGQALYAGRHDLEWRRVMQKLAFLLTINHWSSSIGMELMQEPEEVRKVTAIDDGWWKDEANDYCEERQLSTVFLQMAFNCLCRHCHAFRRRSRLCVCGRHLQLLWQWGSSLLPVQCLFQGAIRFARNLLGIHISLYIYIWSKGVRSQHSTYWWSRSETDQHPGAM